MPPSAPASVRGVPAVVRLSALLITLLGVAVSCSVGPALEPAPPPAVPQRIWIEGMVPDFEQTLRTEAESSASGGALKALLSSTDTFSTDDARLAHRSLLTQAYTDGEVRARFANSEGLTPHGRIALAVLEAATDHDLDPAPLHLPRIAKRLDELEALAAQTPAWKELTLTAEALDRLVRWSIEHELDPDPERGRRQLILAVLRSEPQASPLPDHTTLIHDYEASQQRCAAIGAEVELLIADALLHYARELKLANLANVSWTQLRDAGGSRALVRERLRDVWSAWAQSTPEEFRALLTQLEPRHPQYRRLVSAHRRYRDIVAKGGWPTVRPLTLRLGRTSPRIETLRSRLELEGYLEPDAAPENGESTVPSASESPPPRTGRSTVDDRLLEAVRAYQETHQLRQSADPSPGFWRSLNVPAEQRLEQLRLSLQRWRESRYGGEPNFVFVNLPDFHAEVFEDHQRAMRFRVVVGNTTRVCDPNTRKWTYPNRTPIQVAELDHLILNPSWWIPRRIIEEEIEPGIAEDPAFLEKHHYEWVKMGDGQMRLRQQPGEDNALGLVKFIFPNEHNTYMHDTPSKRFFEFPVRAYSHGCVRVHQPLELARYLLAKDKLATPDEMDAILASGKTRKFDLVDKMPVYFEYYVVWVDDRGHANFLADIYRLDQLRTAEDPEALLECSPKPTAASPPLDGEEGVQDSDVGP